MESVHEDVVEASQVAAARRAVVALAASIGFDETDRARAALVTTEAATNLVKHARDGVIVANALPEAGGGEFLQILSIDRGSGLAHGAEALRDGHSTSGTAGQGLGAIRRAADAFDWHSSTRGLVLEARLAAQRRGGASALADADRAGLPDAGAVCVRMPGETACGDDWQLVAAPGGWLAVVADGLGHGPLAARASLAALAAIDPADPDPQHQLQRMHAALRPTRGAAVGVAWIGERELRFAGVGNVVCRVLHDGRERQLVTHGGIVGHEMRKCQAFAAPTGPGALVVLHSDGLTTQCAVQRDATLASRTAGVVAGVLWRDFLRGRDDSTVLVLRGGSPRGA